MTNAESIIEQTAQELIEEYFRPGNTGFSKACIKAILREMMLKIDSSRALVTCHASPSSLVGEKEAKAMLDEVLAPWRSK